VNLKDETCDETSFLQSALSRYPNSSGQETSVSSSFSWISQLSL
jgi:hypothetical protein